jgi:uncharacterized repeat protein (TIGR01451 family)
MIENHIFVTSNYLNMKKLLLLITICISSVSFGQVPSYVPTNGLVGWWPFNGNANDESGNGNDGTVNGATLTTDRFGNQNSAYAFDGTNWIIVGTDTIPNLSNEIEITFSVWIKKSDWNLGGSQGRIISYENLNNILYQGTALQLQNSGFNLSNSFQCDIRNGSNTVGAGYELDTSLIWHNAVMVFNGNFSNQNESLKLYVDGIQYPLSHFSQTPYPNLTHGEFCNLIFGNTSAGGLYGFGGKIDDIGIWNRALTDCEIQNLYSIGASVVVFNDLDENCIQESEPGLQNVNVSIMPGNYIAVTDTSGIASFPSLSDGTYTATIDTTNLNWSPTCGTSQTFTVTNGQADCIGFGLINDNPCTDPDVSIFAPSLRRCFSDRLVYVSACNQATATGILDSSYVDVELDPLLTVNSASLPYTDIGNNTFRFETGDIYPGQCVNFILSTTVSCDAQNGQTLCMDATLYPAEDCIFDTIPSDPVTDNGIGGTLDGLPEPCTLPWDQSSLEVEGWCQGDSVYFSVTNTGDLGGGDMECYSPVWLTVDGVVTDTDSLQIQGGETVIYSYPASGQTFILNASQHPLHPGNSAPNAHVELCGDSTNWTPGIINQFPQDDADPDVDIYCGQVTAPVDPNDKTGYPLGQTEEYYIQPNQQLQYVIRFQNVGTDTAFTVVVRDTLDIDLNIFTVTPGVASHPYTFKMYGPRVLEWTFEDIQLPDSTTNSEGSNGFLTFHVDQVPDLSPGTVINNDADIYFDFELPITTNTTVHKIFEGFVDVLDPTVSIENYIASEVIDIYPNPTTNLITIQSESVLNNKFKIYDQQGREVMNGKLTGKNTEVSLDKLSRGTYTIQVDGNYKPAVIIKQ